MHKLVILIEPPSDETEFNQTWPEFLHISERMPGLIREATSHVESVLYGDYRPMLQHELFFDSLSDIQAAMRSPEGRATGELLQRLTGGNMSLFIADHKEDDLANIRRYQQGNVDES
jgi:uncharacterized protein (TIGR02118 family)